MKLSRAVASILLLAGAAEALAAGPSSAGVLVPLDDGSFVVAGGSAVVHRYSTLEKLLPAFLGLGYGYGGNTFDSAGLGLAGITANGDPNEHFGKKGFVVTPLPPRKNHDDAHATALVRDARGRLIVVGWRTASTWLDSGLIFLTAARYSAAGAIDTSFGDHGIVTVRMNDDAVTNGLAAILDDQGRLVVAGTNGGRRLHGGKGSFDDWTTHLFLARFTDDGRLDSSFGRAGFAIADVVPEPPALQSRDRQHLLYTRPPAALTIDAQQRLIAGTSASDGTIVLVRFRPDGNLDTTFGSSGMSRTAMSAGSSIAGLLRDRQGRLLAVGTSFDRIAIMRFTAGGVADGVRETSFPAGLAPSAALLAADGNLYVAASSRHVLAIGVFDPDGRPVRGFGQDGIISADVTPLTGPAGLMLNASGEPIVAACSNDGVAVLCPGCRSTTPRVTIVDWGLYGATETKGDKAAPETGAGVVHVANGNEEVPLIRQTDVIDAALGTHFGFRFVVNLGMSAGRRVPMHVHVTHPPINGRTLDQWDIEGQSGPARFLGWRFDTRAELAPGPWKIELLEGDAVVAEKEFLVRVAP